MRAVKRAASSAGPAIHPTAVVDRSVRLGRAVEIGPFCVVGPQVEIGDGTRLLSNVVVSGPTRIGARVEVHPFAAIGGPPQDKTHAGEPTELEIGDEVVVREHVTIHRGTRKDRGTTRVGARTWLMVGVHVAHDVEIGEGCTVANAVQLAGHVVLGDHVAVGGAAAFAPFVQVGECAFVAARAGVEQDVPPFHIVQGDRARVRALNRVGLSRRAVPTESIEALSRAHRAIYRVERPLSVAIEAFVAEAPELAGDPWVARLLDFLRTHQTVPGPKVR
jgi:UDP-N-acetylglucosamine acyltransferase